MINIDKVFRYEEAKRLVKLIEDLIIPENKVTEAEIFLQRFFEKGYLECQKEMDLKNEQ